MGNKLQPHYNDFGGIDSRTNKLQQNPKFARGGKNFRYNYQDELSKMNGFQHKIPTTGAEWGLMEYKFRDINTGESKSEILGIDATGNLNRLKKHYLELTISGGVVDNYTVFYDNDPLVLSWVIRFYNSAGVLQGQVLFTDATLLTALATSINALALTGLTADVVDEDGVTVVSTTCLAYTLNLAVRQKIGAQIENPCWFWEQVPFPDSLSVPFPEVVAQASNPDYEGPTWQNLNNVIYITDGSFPMKYDGKCVYRAGVPKTFPMTAFPGSLVGPGQPGDGGFIVDNVSIPTSGTALANGDYSYNFVFGFRDYNGADYYGLAYDRDSSDGQYQVTISGGSNCSRITIPYMKNGEDFGVFSCKLNEPGGVIFPSTSGSLVLNVDSGHNILVGMFLAIPYVTWTGLEPGYTDYRSTTRTSSFFLARVTDVTTTTVEISGHPVSVFGDGLFRKTADDMVMNGYFGPDDYENVLTQFSLGSIEKPFGFFVDIYRSKVNDPETFYYLDTVSMPRQASEEYVLYDFTADSDLTVQFENSGQDLPRACRYLSKWQDTLMQAGAPYDGSLQNEDYPSFYNQPPLTATGANPAFFLNKYTAAGVCDFQSVYWASQDAPEGFPQDGLNEFLIDTEFNDEIRGLSPNKDSFFAFKTRSTGYLTGTLADNTLALEVLEADVGAACHKSIQEVGGAVFFMDQNQGFWSVVAGRLPVFIGYSIQDKFKDNQILNFRRAVATNFRGQDQYLCHVPAFDQSTDDSLTFVYDYAPIPTGTRTAWYIWQDFDAEGGLLATADDELLFSSRTAGPLVWKQKFTGTKYDYSMHIDAVSMLYLTAWINFGLPVIDKKYVKAWLNSIQGGFDMTLYQYQNYMDQSVAEFEMSFPIESPTKVGVKEFSNLNVDKLSAISLGFENDELYQDVRIQGWELQYAADFDLNEGRK